MRMITNFERHRAQLRCEELLDCSQDLLKWNNCDFENYILTKPDASKLATDLLDDSIDLYFKGLLSLTEALSSINQRLFSWSTIKLYYSVYYFLRSSLASKGYGLIRRKSLFLIKAFEGEKPQKKSNRKYNTDHEGTINYFQDTFSDSDILLSNNIDEKSSYLWIMEKRDQINYRERKFNEPDCSDFWDYINQQVEKNLLSDLIEKYINDNYIYCFQENHAALAIPIKRAILTHVDLNNKFENRIIENDKLMVLKNIIDSSSINTNILEILV
jgi:hypothetical protein